MYKYEVKKYQLLNTFAEENGIVIFGGSQDESIPLLELCQAFSIDVKLYNRSVPMLSVKDSVPVYDDCIANLHPETVLLHLGEADTALFAQNSAQFDADYRHLITHIKALHTDCRIVVISLKNPDTHKDIIELNKHLSYIAESEQCEFYDINKPFVWNPKETQSILSFLYSTGFVRPLKTKRPIYDLIKILFHFDSIDSGIPNVR